MVFGQGVFTDQLHNLIKFVFFLQNFFEGLSQVAELGVESIEIGVELFFVVAGGDVPVQGGEVLSLGQFFVQSPEHLHDCQSGAGNGVGEVSSWGGNGSHDGDGSLSIGGSQTSHLTGSFVELGQFRRQIGGVTSISRHFGQSSGNFSQGFGPSGRRVSHHTDVVTHISVVLGQGDTCVDGGFSGSDGHVRGVGHQTGSLHNRLFFSVDHGGQLGELSEHFGHFVSSFSAPDVDNGLGVRVLRQRLRNAGLTAPEGPGNGAGSSQNGGEQSVQNSLSSQQRSVSLQLLNDRSGLSDRPPVSHSVVSFFLSNFVFQSQQSIFNGVVTIRSNKSNSSSSFGLNHDFVLVEQVIFFNVTVNVSRTQELSDLDLRRGVEFPDLLFRKRSDVDTSGHVNRFAGFGDDFQGSLNTVENFVQNTRSQLNRQGGFGSHDGVSDRDTSSVFVALNRSVVSVQLNDFSDQLFPSDFN